MMRSASVAIAIALLFAGVVQAEAVRTNAGFTTNLQPRNDDVTYASTPLGFTVNFLGTSYSDIFVNTNGNATFGSGSGVYTPQSILGLNRAILAPFWADVDTRNVGAEQVKYGQDTVNGRPAFGANWVNVGYYNNQIDKLNSFQLVVIDRSDIGPGDFDFEFNYDQILWETGSASGGVNGFGGSSARAGWASPVGTAGLELPGSDIDGAFLNSGPNALITHRLNSNVDGRYLFTVRNGEVSAVPEPSSVVLAIFAGIAGCGYLVRQRSRRSS